MSSPALLGGQRYGVEDSLSGSRPIGITSSSTANTKGSYEELNAALAFPAGGLIISAGPASAQGDCMWDVAIGAAAAEQIIWNNIQFSERTIHEQVFFVPLAIPAGSRVAARSQHTSGGAGRDCHFAIVYIAAGALGISSLQRVETYGATTADSGGTGVDPGAVANTKGAYSELVAATGFAIRWLVLAIGGQNNATRSITGWRLDVAIGAAAAEQIIIPNLPICDDALGDCLYPGFFSFPVNIPAGNRIAVRAQCESTDASDRLIDVTGYGLGG